ncbi:MAG TPA: MurR/RpiR family transcriptional regulator [Bacillales bacterium]|nr:MurR/RpiR family transcriptional regulator [Bacillales bacterium]
MADYQTRIKEQYASLSNGLQRVAKLLLDHPKKFAFRTAEQAGREIGVSETTVIRFTYALGYSGYSHLQKEVREYVLDKKSSLGAFQQGKRELKNAERLYDRIMHRDAENILQTAESISESDFNMVVSRLTEADRIMVTGMRSSHSMAHWFAFAMDLIRGETRLFRPETDDVVLRVSEMNERSVFVAFSFHRYVSETLILAEEIRKQGSFIIGVTDSPVSPITQYADVNLAVHLPTQSTLDATPVCFSMLNAITSAVSLQNPERFEKRRRMYESYYLKDFYNI